MPRQAQPWPEYFAQASIKHEYKYSYPKEQPTDGTVNVICATHGLFNLRKNSHKSGNGCQTCSGASFKKLKDDPIEQLKAKHPTFDFSNSVYLSRLKPISFVCPDHGLKTSTPQVIHAGVGCDECAYKTKLGLASHARKFQAHLKSPKP